MENKYMIGQEIDTPDDNKAFIVGMIIGQSVERRCIRSGELHYTWDKEFPGWQNKFVYYVEFMNPVKQASLEALSEVYERAYSPDKILEIYKSQPGIYLLSIPEDGIKLASYVD